MSHHRPSYRSRTLVIACVVSFFALVGFLRPPAVAESRASQDVVDRIQRECLRSYTPEMLREMTSGVTDEVPAEVDAAPEDQDEFLDQVLELDKGLFYPILLEDLVAAFELYIEPGKRFLDLGSGDGRVVYLANVLGAEATGIEYDPGMIEVSQRCLETLDGLVDPERVHLVQSDFFKKSWSGYDVIFYFDLTSFEHFRLRQKIARELDPGARFVVAHQKAAFPGLALETTFESLHVYRQPSTSMHDPTTRQRCQKEVEEMYRFFEGWYNGSLDPTDGSFARIEEVLARSFLQVDENGRNIGRRLLLQRLRRAHGSWRGVGDKAPGTGRIRIENFRLRLVEGPLTFATYEEHRELGDMHNVYMNTAVFRLEHGLPNGVAWYHLHQSKLP